MHNATTSPAVTPDAQQYRVGELVDVTIKGARIMAPKPGIDDVLTLAYEEVEPGVFATIELRHPRAGSVTIERVAPAEWPPRRGDVWRDRHNGQWFAVARSNWIDMVGGGGSQVSAEQLLDDYAPLTLAYRAEDAR